MQGLRMLTLCSTKFHCQFFHRVGRHAQVQFAFSTPSSIAPQDTGMY